MQNLAEGSGHAEPIIGSAFPPGYCRFCRLSNLRLPGGFLEFQNLKNFAEPVFLYECVFGYTACVSIDSVILASNQYRYAGLWTNYSETLTI